MSESPLHMAAHSVEMTCRARVILNAKGESETIILTGDQYGVELKLPGFAYPFVKNGFMVLAIVSVVQVAPADPIKPKGILRSGN